MHSQTRRTLIAGATVGLLAKELGATTSTSGEVIARAAYGGRDDSWEITLMDNYSAKFTARLGRVPAGTVTGDFRFYDTEVADKEQLTSFLQLPKFITAPVPSIHPWLYEITLRSPDTRSLHTVEVSYHRSMQPSERLQLFFMVWRNIWSGVPGYPRAPGQYAG